MKKELSIIIVTYNSQTVIKDCLQSIQKFNDIGNELEIIIVDNSPKFEIEDFVKRLNLNLDIKMIHNPQNGGFGQGNNIGAKKAKGEIFFFLNPDTILIEPIFKFMLGEFENKRLGCAGFRLVDMNFNPNETFGIFPEYSFFNWILKKLLARFINFWPLYKFIFPWGADIVVRKEDFMKAGMFDEKIFLCNEEPDLIRRLSRKKVKIFNRRIVHLEGHTTVVPESRILDWQNSTKYYLQKYGFSYQKYLLNFSRKIRLKKIFKKMMFKSTEAEEKIEEILKRNAKK